jgi:hypothetical protein
MFAGYQVPESVLVSIIFGTVDSPERRVTDTPRLKRSSIHQGSASALGADGRGGFVGPWRLTGISEKMR